MNRLLHSTILAVSVVLVSSVAVADYEPDDDYLDVHFEANRWAAVKTAATPHILICAGVFRYWPAMEPRPVCEEKTKPPGAPNYEPARFYQLVDWLEQNGYKPASFIDIEDDYTLKISINKTENRSFQGEEYEDYFGHEPGYTFSGIGGIENATLELLK